MQECRVHVWLAAASLHEAGVLTFSRSELLAEAERLFADRRTGVKIFMDAHANASAPKADPVVYNYLVRVKRGTMRLCRANDEVHPSRRGAPLWPDRGSVDPEYWPLWERWSLWQGEQAPPAEAGAPGADDGPDPDRRSSYRDTFLEQLLIADLMRLLWPEPVEVDRLPAAVDGCDLLLRCRGVLRHVQFQTSLRSSVTREVPVSVDLARRHGACVVWARFDPHMLAPVEFWWFGGDPGAPMPEISQWRPVRGRHMVPRTVFTRLESVAELAELMFGAPVRTEMVEVEES
jgi:hypothetical protein